MRSPPFHTGPKRPLRSRCYYYNYYKRRIKQRPLRSRYYKRRIKQRSRWTKNVAQPSLDKDKNQDHRQWMRKSQTAPKFELRQVQKRCVRNPSTGARNVLFETVMHGLAKDAVLSCSTQRAKVASCFPYASPSGKAEGSADFNCILIIQPTTLFEQRAQWHCGVSLHHHWFQVGARRFLWEVRSSPSHGDLLWFFFVKCAKRGCDSMNRISIYRFDNIW